MNEFNNNQMDDYCPTELRLETKNYINQTLLRTVGMSYEKFIMLDSAEQQRIIKEHRAKMPQSKDKRVIVQIGSGESSIFVKANKGETILVGSGENAFFTEAGLTAEESIERLNDRIDEMTHSKPMAVVRKLVRKITKSKK